MVSGTLTVNQNGDLTLADWVLKDGTTVEIYLNERLPWQACQVARRGADWVIVWPMGKATLAAGMTARLPNEIER
jgi:hypothetical protein